MKRFSVIFTTILLIFLLIGCGKEQLLHLSGTVEATESRVVSEVSGKILSLLVEEGTIVNRGDMIAVVDDQAQQLTVKQMEAVVKAKKALLDELYDGSRMEQIAQAQAGVDAAKAKLDEAIRGSRPEQVQQAEAGVAITQAGVDTAQMNVDYIQKNYDRSLKLFLEGTLNETGLDEAKFNLDNAKAALQSAETQLESAIAQLELVKGGVGEEAIRTARANYNQALAQLDLVKNGPLNTTIEAARADLEHAQATLEHARLILSKYKIPSPMDGILTLPTATEGEIVNAGGTVGIVTDNQEKYVRFYVPQRYLSLVEVGQTVSVTISSLPETPVTGKITYIATKAEFTPRNTETNESKESTVFKIKVKLMDYVDQIHPGMTANTTFEIPDILK